MGTCVAIDLTWMDDCIEVHVDGDFPNQMVAMNKAITGDPRHKKISRMLINALDADHFYADDHLVGTMAEMDVMAYDGAPRMRLAVVTDNPKMARIVQTYAAHYESLKPGAVVSKVFDNLAEARTWLGT